MKVVVTRGHRGSNALVIHLPRAVDVFSQAIVDVAAAAAFLNLRFVVKFDFRNQHTRDASRVVVQAPFFIANLDWEVRFAHAITPRAAAQRSRVLRSKAGRGRRRHFSCWFDCWCHGLGDRVCNLWAYPWLRRSAYTCWCRRRLGLLRHDALSFRCDGNLFDWSRFHDWFVNKLNGGRACEFRNWGP